MTIQILANNVWNDIEKIRSASPLVHNITNYVVMNNTANALLAIGASPVMAHAVEEVEDMVNIASTLVINIGTLSQDWIIAMKAAIKAAAARSIPIILDPVGVGATSYRTRTCHELFDQAAPTIIRGNASEIMALTDSSVQTKGVDSTTDQSPLVAAQNLAKQQSCIVVVSGETDLITDGEKSAYIRNGHAWMPKVTGLGCTATALTGAFAAVQKDPFLAAAHTMAVMGICGEIAAEKSSGPGSLQMNFIDTLFQLNEQQITDLLKG
jgi:hydroxyethylthiazole kinase